MNHFSKLNQKQQMFVEQISAKCQSKSTAVSIAMARAINIDLPLPSHEVTDPCSFLNTLPELIKAHEKIDFINNIAIIDRHLVMELVKKIYRYRYQQAFLPKNMLSFNTEEEHDFFGITRIFDKEILEIMKQEKAFIMQANAGFVSIFSND